ncbi:MAG: FHA domain-containing protein [Tepidisphaeraceae bacterium]
MATLLVETSQGPVAIQLRGPSVLGRDETCMVRIDHATLSRRHAKLAPMPDGSWVLVDLGSQNGCRIEGHRVRGTVPIPDGATLRFGRVRAWLFRTTAPAGWTMPSDDRAMVEGHEVRCNSCGQVSWAPTHAAGLELKCKGCGRR